MPYLTIVLLALVLAIDATTVAITDGFCYGLKMERKTKILLPVIFGFFQGLMPLIGYYLFSLLANNILWLSDISNYIAAGLLGILGIKMIIDGIKEIVKRKKIPQEEDIICEEKTPQLRKREIVVQAIATSIDALAVGISIYVAHSQDNPHPDIWIATLTIAVVTAITTAVGFFAGVKIGPFVKKYAPIIGGAVLITLAFNFIFNFLF